MHELNEDDQVTMEQVVSDLRYLMRHNGIAVMTFKLQGDDVAVEGYERDGAALMH